MKHLIAYEGKANVALGVMQEAYAPLFVPWVNWRIGIEGTLQRPPYSIAQGIEWIRSLDQHKGKKEVFAVLRKRQVGGKPGYEYVGHMGIHNVKWPEGTGTTGSILGATNARGRGLGTEAKLLILYHGFNVMNLRKLLSEVKSFNAPSAGHLLKCGYQYVGRNRKHCCHEGSYCDSLSFEIFREDWLPIWEQYQQTGKLPKLSKDQRAFLESEMKDK